MSAIAIHRAIRGLRRTAALVAVTCVLGGIVAIEHSGMADMHAPEMVAFCLAVIPGSRVPRPSLRHRTAPVASTQSDHEAAADPRSHNSGAARQSRPVQPPGAPALSP